MLLHALDKPDDKHAWREIRHFAYTFAHRNLRASPSDADDIANQAVERLIKYYNKAKEPIVDVPEKTTARKTKIGRGKKRKKRLVPVTHAQELYANDEHFKRSLRCITRRACIDLWKEGKCKFERVEDLAFDPGQTTPGDERALTNELLAAVEEAIPEHYELFAFKKFGFSNEAIAVAFNTTESAIKGRWTRFENEGPYQKLKDHLVRIGAFAAMTLLTTLMASGGGNAARAAGVAVTGGATTKGVLSVAGWLASFAMPVAALMILVDKVDCQSTPLAVTDAEPSLVPAHRSEAPASPPALSPISTVTTSSPPSTPPTPRAPPVALVTSALASADEPVACEPPALSEQHTPCAGVGEALLSVGSRFRDLKQTLMRKPREPGRGPFLFHSSLRIHGFDCRLAYFPEKPDEASHWLCSISRLNRQAALDLFHEVEESLLACSELEDWSSSGRKAPARDERGFYPKPKGEPLFVMKSEDSPVVVKLNAERDKKLRRDAWSVTVSVFFPAPVPSAQVCKR